jgi:hypothetical protein
MLKKVLAGAFVALMIGAIVFGAVQLASQATDGGDQVHARAGWEGRAQQAALSQGQSGGQGAVSGRGRGQGAWSEEDVQAGQGRGQQTAPQGSGQDERGRGQQTTPQGSGQAGRGGQGAGQNAPRSEDAPLAQEVTTETLEGIVVETVELTIDTGEQTVQIGLGPSFYREEQGFALEIGERVRVSGFYEDGEFKAQQVTKLATGESITLRDDDGRPMWAGRGRGRS